MIRFFYLLAFFAILATSASAAIINCPTCSQDDFENAYYVQSQPGDTIVLPAGSATWGNPSRPNSGIIYIITNVTVQGQGDSTVITMDNGGATYSNGVIACWAAATFKDMKFIGSSSAPVTTFQIQPYNNTTTGINFTGGFRLTNITYEGGLDGYFAYIGNDITSGLIDNCRLTGNVEYDELIYAKGPSNAWSTASQAGTANNIFIEDCTFNNVGYVNDGNSNSNTVVRFNTMNGTNKVDSHGYASNSQPVASVRWTEVYHNTWTKTGAGNWTNIEIRGGTGMFFNNSSVVGWFYLHDYAYDSEPRPWQNFGVNASMAFGATTTITTVSPHGFTTGWPVWVQGQAFGISSVRSIQSGGTGYNIGNVLTVSGGTANIAATLTVSSVSSGVITGVTITESGNYKTVPSDPVSVTGGSGSGATFNLNWGGASSGFNSIFSFYNVTVTGSSTFTIPLNSPYNINLDYVGTYKTPVDYPITQQVGRGNSGSEPAYLWGNTQGGSPWARTLGTVCADALIFYNAQLSTSGATFTDRDVIQSNRDFYADAGFDTNTGVTVGTAAQMAVATPTNKRGFWVTDEGSWWTGHPNSSGRLYVGNGSSWVLSYTPYAYPHPLRASAPTYVSGAINTSGNALTLTLSVSCTTGAGGNGGVTISASGGVATATYSSGSGSTAYVYSLSRTINMGETVTVSYTQPGNGIEATSDQTDLASFSTQPVTNNSTQGGKRSSISGKIKISGKAKLQ